MAILLRYICWGTLGPHPGAQPLQAGLGLPPREPPGGGGGAAFVRAALQKEAAIVARELQIPLFTPAYLRTPYLTGPQKPYFASVITRLLRKVPCTSWERQALKSRIFLVRTVPHTVRSVFERHSNKTECSSAPPPCHCHTSLRATWEQAGPLTIYDGHLAMLPLQLQHQDLHLKSKDPLPIRGPEARAAAIKECTTLARLLNVPMNEKWDISLPKAIFLDTGELLNWVQHIAHQVSEVAVARVVDKFPRALWGFCRRWMWEQLQEFLHKERYQRLSSSAKQILQGLNQLLTRKGWCASGDARVALLYLIGKGKSLRLPAITWRRICAVARPVIPRYRLCLAVRAFSCFLRVLTSEITGCFHHHNVHSFASWYTWLDSWSCTHVTEADCKDEFNNVDPALVVKYLKESTEWLKPKRQWRSTQMCWSIHKTDKAMDRS